MNVCLLTVHRYQFYSSPFSLYVQKVDENDATFIWKASKV